MHEIKFFEWHAKFAIFFNLKKSFVYLKSYQNAHIYKSRSFGNGNCYSNVYSYEPLLWTFSLNTVKSLLDTVL